MASQGGGAGATPPPPPQQHPVRRFGGKASLKHVLLGCVCALVFMWWTRSGMRHLRSSSSSSLITSSSSVMTNPSDDLLPPGVLDEEEEDEEEEEDAPHRAPRSSSKTTKRLVQVSGQSFIIKRDLPLIRRGYLKAMRNQLTFVRNPKKAPDMVLCLSLHACLGRSDAGEPSSPTTLVVNRVPHLQSVLWSKKAFCESVPKWVASLVSFPCWVLPDSSLEMRDFMGSEGQLRQQQKRWIAKPHASGGGFGIFVVESERELREVVRSRRPLVVQPFLGNPMLVKRRKVDLRVYVLVTSTAPMRVYVHSRGLVRFASQAYVAERAVETSPTSEEDGDGQEEGEGEAATTTTALVPVTPANRQQSKSQFLTNTSINKKTSKMTAAELTWSFQQLWDHMGPTKARRMRMKMDRSIALILLSVENKFHKLTPRSVKTRRYHLLGMDVIFSDREEDEAKVIEVNGEPSFEGSNLEDAASGEFAHYDETKIKVAGDVASIVLSPALPAGFLDNNYDGEPEFAHYCSELERESLVRDTEFRLVYPSAVSELLKQQHAGLAERALQDAGSKRVALHHYLVEREAQLFHAHCSVSKRECGRAVEENGRALVFDDLVQAVADMEEAQKLQQQPLEQGEAEEVEAGEGGN